MHQDVSQILYSREQIAARVAELGAQITSDYAGKDLVVVCILRGAALFMADLVRAIELPVEVDFMAVSSYGSAAKSSGTVSIEKDLSSPVEGRHVLIVEDILDTGITLSKLVPVLEKRGAASVEIAALLLKQGAQKVDITSKYTGFACPDEFIVGYGLDYAQKYRNLPYIGALKRSVYEGE